MCLSTVYVGSKEQHKEFMREVSHIEAQDDGFLVTAFLGKQEYIDGKIISIDFGNDHGVLIQET